jgi:uncharacterized NAD(P)/FAD-binding protein YdhS
MGNKRKLAIIGVGPRGLNALENFMLKLSHESDNAQIQLYLFEETGDFGNGQVYNTNQVESNWINISERILCLDEMPEIQFDEIQIPSFPSYHSWANIDIKTLPENLPDTYPPRSKIGEYLKMRFENIIQPLMLGGNASLYTEKVENVKLLDNGKIDITTNLNLFKHIDEVLLTIGHQPTFESEQIAEWESYFKKNDKTSLLKSPYPIDNILKCANLSSDSTIGIRGFGLAMIDVARALANKFGKFELDNYTQTCTYIPNHNNCPILIPFSLDGLPPAPKPLNAHIDKLFEPTKEQISQFESKISDSTIHKNAVSPKFLICAIAPIVANIFIHLDSSIIAKQYTEKGLEHIVQQWLEDEKYEHPLITSQKKSTFDKMKDYVAMANHSISSSLDYCIGQVWRHCQPSIYEKLSYNECSEEVFAEIINLDERLKRYSYGPPVESIQQMLALIEAGVMNLDLVNNPTIELTSSGWQLVRDNKSSTADIMINSVLNAPQIKQVNSPIVTNMLSNELIQAVHDDFGVLTDENGYLIPKNNDQSIPIALLGRLAKGTIIGVDAILECFGQRPVNWAIEAVRRHKNSLSEN